MNIEALYKIYLSHPSIITDTRKLKQGDLYFALKGPNFNGNVFAQQALNNGAAYAIIDEEAYVTSEKTVLVPDALKTLQALATHHRQQFNIPFIAITGSNGKTTTKELIHVILSSTYKTYTTEGNLNNHIGVPLTILKIKKDAQYAIIEMGANHLEEIKSYCLIAQPTHGLITNCGKAHLEGFGSEEGVKKGKGELFDYLRENNGTAFIMQDYDYLHELSKGIAQKFSYGTSDADIVGDAVVSETFLKVSFKKGITGTLHTNLVGTYNLPNVLAAVAVGTYFRVEENKIKEAIEHFVPSNSRSQLVEKNSNKIILDAYNANPSSMIAAIKNFAYLKAENKYLVLGAMAELGNDSLKEHQDIINEISNFQWKSVLLVGGDFLKLSHPYQSFQSASEAGEWLNNKKIENSYLLIKGSRSIGMEKVINYLEA